MTSQDPSFLPGPARYSGRSGLRGLGLDGRDPHLDDVARGEQSRQEGGVAPVVLASPVGNRPVHPGDQSNDIGNIGLFSNAQ